MSCEETTALLADRLKGLISADDERRLEAHLDTCAACREEATTTTELWANLGDLDAEVPHERLRARFHAALAVYEAHESSHWLERAFESWWPRQPALQAGLAAALALVGVLVGQQLPSATDDEVAALRAEVRTVGLALLDHQSAAERLLGVAWSQRTEQAPDVVNALLERIRYDSNVNVRLAAVDALRSSITRPDVSAGLATALEGQDAPIMQVTITDALLETGSRDAVEAVRRMLGRDGLDPAVREYAQTALAETGADAAPNAEI
jgi:anti-sigma factor RsiW